MAYQQDAWGEGRADMRAAANRLFGIESADVGLFYPYFEDEESKAETYQELLAKQRDPEFQAKVQEKQKALRQKHIEALKAKQNGR